MKSLNPEAEKAFNKDLRQKSKALSHSELSTTRAALQKEWDAQPAARKEKASERIAERAKGAATKVG
ncbi:MAG: hypothetical protein M3Y22_02220 [Pseudomonadota bacterium]|nr:hypothetical protein [Pseudomonadota bacterium]